jgi:hypothetical protein
MNGEKFCFVHMDADIYQSTKAGLEFFWPKMVRLGAMVFDDWNYKGTKGVEYAITEYFADKPDDKFMLEAVPNQLTIIKKGL